MTEHQRRTTRRRLLGGLGAAVTVGLAGCTDVTGGPGADGGGSTATTRTTTRAAGTTTADSTTDGTTVGETTQTTETTTESSVKTPDGPVDPAFVAASGETEYGVPLGGAPIMGQADAAVDVYFWSDFQCPFCRKFVTRTLPKLAVNEVANGTARVVFLELPNIGKKSTQAAKLGKCVWRTVREDDPGKYWDWHHAVFENQGYPDGEWASRENLLALTEEAGVDADAVTACLEEHGAAVKEGIGAEAAVAAEHDLSATPSFGLYAPDDDRSTTLVGAQPYDRFHSAIQSLAE